MSSRLFPFAFLVLSGVALADPPQIPVPPADAVSSADDASPAAKKPAAPKGSVDMQDIRAFTAVYSLVKQAYVENVDDHELMQAAIRGLLAGLDPHSEYLDRHQLDDLTEDTTGSYNGLGIEVVQVDGTLRVIAPIDDSPAERGGIKAGDIIVRIDGKPVQSDDLDSAVGKLRGKVGTDITLGVVHEGTADAVDIRLKREVIRVASVRGRLLEPGYAYVRISQFQADTGAQLHRRIERLQKDDKTPLRGLVLDLRSNPGGLLTSAVEVSDVFLDDGVIVTTKGRLKEADLSFRASPGDALNGAPIVFDGVIPPAPNPEWHSHGDPVTFAKDLAKTLDGVQTTHHGHMPEIEFTSDTTAEGIWAMEDMLRWPKGAPIREMHGYGHYRETYVKLPEGWRIKSLKLTRLRVDVSPWDVAGCAVPRVGCTREVRDVPTSHGEATAGGAVRRTYRRRGSISRSA